MDLPAWQISTVRLQERFACKCPTHGALVAVLLEFEQAEKAERASPKARGAIPKVKLAPQRAAQAGSSGLT
jgi:hypothetical protein